jgi:hypothetical protein
MEYYSSLDNKEREVLDNYSSRLNLNSASTHFSPQLSNRTFASQRLPMLQSFTSALERPPDSEIVPKSSAGQRSEKSERSEKPSKKKAKLRKRSSVPRLNGRFYTEKGLNFRHPELKSQMKKIFNLVENHKLKCHQELKQVDFAALKKYFFRLNT